MTARVALAGGGTAGHLFPCLAVAQRLQDLAPEAKALFLGARRGVDARLLRQLGLEHRLLNARPFPYRVSLELVKSSLALVRGFAQARAALRRFRPDVLFASGGYVAGPAVLAARTLGVPCVIHVGDALPDRTGRALSRYAERITLAFETAAEYFDPGKTLYTGPPIRKEFFAHSREEGVARFGLDPARRTLLVTGGSQGARAINNALLGALPKLLQRTDLQIVHLTGQLDFLDVGRRTEELGAHPPAYRGLAFCQDMGLAYAAADLVLSRAGSSSLGEAMALGKPMVVVPYPHAAGHQLKNAAPLAEAGAVVIIENAALTGQSLLEALERLLDDPGRLETMAQAAQAAGRPHAAEQIARLLLEIAQSP